MGVGGHGRGRVQRAKDKPKAAEGVSKDGAMRARVADGPQQSEELARENVVAGAGAINVVSARGASGGTPGGGAAGAETDRARNKGRIGELAGVGVDG